MKSKTPKSSFVHSLKNNFLKADLFTIAGITVFLYITYINFFVVTAEIHIIAIQFFIFILIFMRGRKTEFLKDWLPYLAGFFVYELLRGLADNISPFYDSTLYAVYMLEDFIFPQLPTIFLQNNYLGNELLVQISTFFYTSFFYYSFLVGFFIWLFKRNVFHQYFIGFTILSYIGVIFFFLIPTAPPWFIHIEGLDTIRRVIWDETMLSKLQIVRLFTYFEDSNQVAALPSLHTGWSTFTSFFLIKHFGWKMAVSLIVPIMIAFSVVFTGEHFLIDIILGGLLAYLAVTSTFVKLIKKLL